MATNSNNGAGPSGGPVLLISVKDTGRERFKASHP